MVMLKIGDDSDVAGNIGVIFILIFLLRFKYVVLGTYISYVGCLSRTVS